MVLLARAGFLTALLVLPASVWADPPKLTGTSPLGVQRGKSMEVIFQGSGLVDGPRLVAPFGFRLEESAGEWSRGGRLEGPTGRRCPDRGRGLPHPRRDGLGGVQPDLVRGRPGAAGAGGRAEQHLRPRTADPEPGGGRRGVLGQRRGLLPVHGPQGGSDRRRCGVLPGSDREWTR